MTEISPTPDTPLKARFRKLFYERILPSEGAYSFAATPGSYRDSTTKDPDTLFGVTYENWVLYSKSLGEIEIANLEIAQDIRGHLSAMALATTKENQSINARTFILWVVADLYKQNPTIENINGIAKNPEKLSAEDIKKIDQLKAIAFEIFYKYSVQEPGFDKYPDFIVPYLADHAMNAGPDAAKSVLRNALKNTIGIASDSPSQLAALPPDLHRKLVEEYNKERKVFYEKLGQDIPRLSGYVPGWKTRVVRFDEYARVSWQEVQQETEIIKPTSIVHDAFLKATATTTLDGTVIDIAIPNSVTFISFIVSNTGEFKDWKNLPKGASVDSPSDLDRNPFPGFYTVSWREEGQRKYIKIDPARNLKIIETSGGKLMRPNMKDGISADRAESVEVFTIPEKVGYEMERRPLPKKDEWPRLDNIRFSDGTSAAYAMDAVATKSTSNAEAQREIKDIMQKNPRGPIPMVIEKSSFVKIQSKDTITKRGTYKEIAIEIPNKGIIRYFVDENYNFVSTNYPLPSGISFESGVNNEDRNPYDAPAYSWLDKNGERQYIPANNILNARIIAATTPAIPLTKDNILPMLDRATSARLGSTFDFTDDKQVSLDPGKSGYLAVASETPFGYQTFYAVDNATYTRRGQDFCASRGANSSLPDSPPQTPICTPPKTQQRS